MLLPHLEHLYRFIADIGGDPVEAPGTRGPGQTISAANMARGIVTGPRVNGKVLENSGTDLATRVDSDRTASCISRIRYSPRSPSASSDEMCNHKVYMLESRYTIIADDETAIVVDAKGLFSHDPSAPQTGVRNSPGSQDKRDSFSRLTYRAPKYSSYSWMNSIVAIGVMSIWDGKVVNDAYRVETISLDDARNLLDGQEGKRSD